MKLTLKLTSLFLCFVLILTNVNASAFTNSDTVTNPVLKIGLLYGSNTTPTTNLDNYNGSGHAFGYFNDNRNFVEVFDTNTEAITTMRNSNIYLGNDNLYYSSAISSYKGIVGGYTLELSGTFNKTSATTKANSITNGFVAYIDGAYKVRVGTYSSSTNANTAKNSLSSLGTLTVIEPSQDTYTVTNTKTTNVLFQFSNNSSFGVLPKGTITWTKGYRYYGGFEYSRLTGGDLTVLNVVHMQDYLKGVLPYEMSASWNVEALKAQALCARSYAFANLNKHKTYGFDLCNDTDCQVYRGTSQASANSDSAVDGTYGQYIDYNGAIATGFFHSSDGGATENSENVWVATLPYLRGVIDTYENTDSVSNGVWSQTITNSDIEWILNAKGYAIDGVSNMYVSAYTDLGNVYTLTIEDKNGKKYNFSKESARTILNSTTKGITVNSIRYRINEVMPTYSGGGTSSLGSDSVYVNEVQYNTSDGFYVKDSSGTTYADDITGMYVLSANGTTKLGQEVSTEPTLGTGAPISTKAGEYVISGRGWGHNVGMSQYGALAMANQGFSYQEIIKFYFTGTSVVTKK